MTAFLRPEEEGFRLSGVVDLRDEDRAADGEAIIMLLVDRPGGIEIVAGIEVVVAQELEHVAVEMGGAGLGL